MSTDVKSRRVIQGEETRDALIGAARELFGTQGYAATSTEEIVSKAGVTKGALYHHFSDKERLFRAVYEQIQREISDASVVEFLQADKFEPLVTGCQLWVDSHSDPIVRQIVLVDARGVLGPEVTRQIETRFSTVALRGALRTAMHAGVIERRPLRPLAFMLIGALTEACLYVAAAEDAELARDEVSRLILDLLAGLRAA
ncbi:MAG: TetR/AcrR family transcriptional regulator [Frankiaceae bacterium]|nr:TetR/AcrR family transcriptional regulator [Frankiaceae bacterium]MBV9870720.1 TetR/AcrR family transcriptional regulator [Frankiaceae bacterium]